MRIDWRAKALLQGALSHLPRGERLNDELRRRTGGLPLGDAELRNNADLARRHLEAIERLGSTPLGEAQFFEFGAGWDLHIPLSLYSLGVNRQILVDLAPMADPALVDDIAQRLTDTPLPGAVRTPATAGGRTLDQQLQSMGIRYLAPADAADTKLPSASVDYVTSTNTLEHIPERVLVDVLVECRRILRPGGMLSCYIDYQDHHSYFDPEIGPYHFLRYSERRWRLFNSSLHFQNRLRHSDHLALIDEAGFEVIEQRTEDPDDEDLASLATLPLDARFAGRPLTDLGVRWALVVATPRA